MELLYNFRRWWAGITYPQNLVSQFWVSLYTNISPTHMSVCVCACVCTSHQCLPRYAIIYTRRQKQLFISSLMVGGAYTYPRNRYVVCSVYIYIYTDTQLIAYLWNIAVNFLYGADVYYGDSASLGQCPSAVCMHVCTIIILLIYIWLDTHIIICIYIYVYRMYTRDTHKCICASIHIHMHTCMLVCMRACVWTDVAGDGSRHKVGQYWYVRELHARRRIMSATLLTHTDNVTVQASINSNNVCYL